MKCRSRTWSPVTCEHGGSCDDLADLHQHAWVAPLGCARRDPAADRLAVLPQIETPTGGSSQHVSLAQVDRGSPCQLDMAAASAQPVAVAATADPAFEGFFQQAQVPQAGPQLPRNASAAGGVGQAQPQLNTGGTV